MTRFRTSGFWTRTYDLQIPRLPKMGGGRSTHLATRSGTAIHATYICVHVYYTNTYTCVCIHTHPPIQRLHNKALTICLNVENRRATSELHKQTKSATLQTRKESRLKVMVFTYSRETKYYSQSNKKYPKNWCVNPYRHTVASYDRSVKSMAAHIWNEQPSTTRNIKSIEAYKKHLHKTKQNDLPQKTMERIIIRVLVCWHIFHQK